MREQHIYKAKSTSLVVLLLLLFSGVNNKTCKTIPGSPDQSFATVASDSLSHKKISPKSVTQERQERIQPIPTEKVPDSSTAKAKAILVVTPTVAKAVLKDSIAKVEKKAVLKTQVEDVETELAQLSSDYPQEGLLPRAGKTHVDSTIAATKVKIENTKLLEKTGSNYFNTSVQGNMNDQLNSIYTTKLLYDSVVSSSNKDFVYNTLTVSNTTGSKIEIQVIVTSPEGWQMVTTNIVSLTLEPFANSIIPMRFTPSGNNTAVWKDVTIEYRLNNVTDTRKTFFRIKVQEYSSFKASLPNSNKVITNYQKNNEFPILIKNAGNTAATYRLTVANQLLKLGADQKVLLAAGKDTTIYFPFTLSESQFSMLKKEDIKVAVANEKGETINLIQALSKVGYLLKDHASAYLDMPLQLEAGLMYQGSESPVQYYGALYGSVDLTADDHLSMSLRSNTIAQGQTNNNSIVRFDYSGKHIQASAGNIQGAGEFMVDGYGARVGYNWKENKAEVFAMLKSRVGDAKVVGAASQLSLTDNLRFYDAVSLAKDNVREMNSGILSQITEYKFNNGRFALITGVGAEKNDATLVEGTKTTLIGSSLGYNFQWSTKHLAVMSNVLYNSNSYPGTFKGQRLQTHDVRWLIKKNFVGAYYEYNFRKQNYWTDTLLFQDVFNTKTTNYGLKAGMSLKGVNVVAAAGIQRQMQQGESTPQTMYNYVNLNVSTVLFKSLFVNLNSFGGNMQTVEEPGHSAFVSTTQATVQCKAIGASIRYDNGPYYYNEFLAYIQKPESYQRVIFSPYAEVHLLKKTLSARVQGNYAQTLPSDISTTTVLTNINYSHKGYDFNINGIVPVGGSSEGRSAYVNAAFRMRLKAPFVAVRKYYNLKLVLFKDVNSNGVKDAGEEPIAGQTLSLNGDLFVSDGDGLVVYKNTEKGTYKADFGFTSKLKGWIPNNGTVQQFEVSSNKSIQIPYKVSRVLSGQLLVEKDSLSNATFNPGNIKVTATGEKGEVYSTLTNENGEFYFNLPAGNYIVTLSDIAFNDQFKPIAFSQTADLVNNQNKSLYFEIKQKRRQINIHKR
ncbi:MAG TPA: hypothetical protein VL093_07610 [Flavipsychrobacter sp.]|nr:hypothetical protein [Flavipsychrobacter sp.]